MTNTNDAAPGVGVIDVLADHGFTREAAGEEFADLTAATIRWALGAFLAIRPEPFGLTGVRVDDTEVTVVALNRVGLTLALSKFGTNELGLRMLAGTLAGIAEEPRFVVAYEALDGTRRVERVSGHLAALLAELGERVDLE